MNQSPNRLRKLLNCEKLESRFLLAADIVVQVDRLTVDAADSASSVVRIFNNGDQDAKNVQISSKLTDQFVDPIWRRERGYAQIVRGGALEGEGDVLGEPLRDINGDGRGDYFVREYSDSVLVWGGAFPNDQFTADEAIEAIKADPSGALGVVIPAFSPLAFPPESGFGSTAPATFVGDVNGDGYGDLAFNRNGAEILLGGPVLHTRSNDNFFSFRTPGGTSNAFPYALPEAAIYAGDLNGDGVDDLVLRKGGGNPCFFSSQRLIRGCAATDDILSKRVRGGAYVVLGRSDFPKHVQPSMDGVFSFGLSTLYGEGWPQPSAADRSCDSCSIAGAAPQWKVLRHG